MTGPFTIDPDSVGVLLCDADGNLFPSEEPAFVASADVTNRFLEALGVTVRYAADELRITTTGLNFRSTAVALAAANGVPIDPALRAPAPAALDGSGDGGVRTDPQADGDPRPALTATVLDSWVSEEKAAVSAYLGEVLVPDPEVDRPLRLLADRYVLAAVSSSALTRLDACFEATGLADLFDPSRRFSAEDSLPRPTSKPDPAVYLHALHELGVPADRAVAVEDSIPGATSAVAAGIRTVGNLVFVSPAERPDRRVELSRVGVVAVIESWAELVAALAPTAATSR